MVRVVVALLIAAGCPLVAPPPPQPTDAEAFELRWKGRTEDDVLLHYGKPQDVIPLSNGNRVDSYRREFAVSSASGGSYGNSTGTGSSYGSQSTTIFCERRFEIDARSGVVLRAAITGNRCNYDL
jgi:hypothetical protein